MSRVVSMLAASVLFFPVSFGQTKSGTPHAAYSATTVNEPAPADPLDEKSTGPAVLRAEILLDRAGFSVGEIDGTIGTNAMHAVAGFRAARSLPAGTSVDADVWTALNMDTEPALVSYTTTPADVKGPFVKVPKDIMLQAKLPHLGYSSPLEDIAEKFHVRPLLLQQLNPGRAISVAGQKILVPNVRAQLKAQADRVVVSKAGSTLYALDADGKVIAQYPCTSGSEHDPLPIGEWKVTGVMRNPKFNYNPDLFWDAKPNQAKATIAPGPRNPVGLVWIDLSKEHYGIHGTPAPGQIGHTESHGCIRLTNWDARELAGMVMPGTTVLLTE